MSKPLTEAKPFRDREKNVARAQREASERNEPYCVCRLYRNYIVMAERSALAWVRNPKHRGAQILETCEPEGDS